MKKYSVDILNLSNPFNLQSLESQLKIAATKYGMKYIRTDKHDPTLLTFRKKKQGEFDRTDTESYIIKNKFGMTILIFRITPELDNVRIAFIDPKPFFYYNSDLSLKFLLERLKKFSKVLSNLLDPKHRGTWEHSRRFSLVLNLIKFGFFPVSTLQFKALNLLRKIVCYHYCVPEDINGVFKIQHSDTTLSATTNVLFAMMVYGILPV